MEFGRSSRDAERLRENFNWGEPCGIRSPPFALRRFDYVCSSGRGAVTITRCCRSWALCAVYCMHPCLRIALDCVRALKDSIVSFSRDTTRLCAPRSFASSVECKTAAHYHPSFRWVRAGTKRAKGKTQIEAGRSVSRDQALRRFASRVIDITLSSTSRIIACAARTANGSLRSSTLNIWAAMTR